jgi:hypothetical protein
LQKTSLIVSLKGSGAKTNWLAVNHQSLSNSDSDSDSDSWGTGESVISRRNVDHGNLYTRFWLDLVNWTKRVLDRVVFTDFNLRCVFTANSRLAQVVSVKFAARPRASAVLWTWVHTKKTDVPVAGFRKDWPQKLASHATTNKYSEAASVVQRVYKVLSDTENLARCTPAKVGEALGGPLLWIAQRRTEV